MYILNCSFAISLVLIYKNQVSGQVDEVRDIVREMKFSLGAKGDGRKSGHFVRWPWV